jgi:hypothetical protein
VTSKDASLLPCPFCGSTPRHGLGKVQHCQLHGDPYQNYRVWCAKDGAHYDSSHARVSAGDKDRAVAAWNAHSALETTALLLLSDRNTLIDAASYCRQYVQEKNGGGNSRNASLTADRLDSMAQRLYGKAPAEHPDKERLDFVAAEYLHLIPFDMPTGQGDADVGWRALQSHMGKDDAEIACVYTDDLREVIDAARGALKTEGSQS